MVPGFSFRKDDAYCKALGVHGSFVYEPIGPDSARISFSPASPVSVSEPTVSQFYVHEGARILLFILVVNPNTNELSIPENETLDSCTTSVSLGSDTAA